MSVSGEIEASATEDAIAEPGAANCLPAIAYVPIARTKASPRSPKPTAWLRRRGSAPTVTSQASGFCHRAPRRLVLLRNVEAALAQIERGT
jgi:hypothetical protein